MCRVLAYLGAPARLDDLLYKPDSSLIRQAYAPQMLHMLNLAGFGLAAWDPASHEPGEPFVYRTPTLPMFDANLRALARKVRPGCALAHVRGVSYHDRAQLGEINLHPFRAPDLPLLLAHNGDLHRFAEIKLGLLQRTDPRHAANIRGTTDSEHMYALLLSQLSDPRVRGDGPTLVRAIERMLREVRVERRRAGIDTSSPVNLFLADGETVVAVRFTFDFGCYPTDDPARVHPMQLHYLSMWYSLGTRYEPVDGEWRMNGPIASADSVILASEPLTRDTSSWLEVPEYTALWFSRRGGRLELGSYELDA